MQKIRTLLVDDEFLALNLLEQFITQLPDFEIIAKTKSPLEALQILNSQQIEVLFLDIQMPSLSGNNLLRTLNNPPVTIFTTAYADYAPEAFDLNAVDYLLKPFSFERFLQAVNKARTQLQQQKPGTPANASNAGSPDFFAVKVDGKVQKIFFKDILYIEGLKEYVRLHCTSNRHVTLESLKNLETILPADQFLRVHKSYIVAKTKVSGLPKFPLVAANEKRLYRLFFTKSRRLYPFSKKKLAIAILCTILLALYLI